MNLIDRLITVDGFTMPEKEFLRDILLRICQCGGVEAITPPLDVWSPDSIFPLQESVVVGPRWIGTVPFTFDPDGGLRISVNQNAGMSVEFNLTIGQDDVPLLDSSYVWTYSAGVDSILIPFSAFSAAVQASGMPAGARVDCEIVSVTGPYGFDLKGFRADFIGRWRA